MPKPINLDDNYFLSNFNTKLSPQEEANYQAWLQKESQRRGRDLSKDVYNYDLRGYYKDIGSQDLTSTGHMTDVYKKPNHPTFSDQSKYNGITSPTGNKFVGGRWASDGSSFTPSTQMLSSPDAISHLKQYMQRAEPNVQLIIGAPPK